MRITRQIRALTFWKAGVHRVFPVEEVSELDVINESVIIGIATVKQLNELFVADGNVELTARLVQIFLRY